MLFYIVISIIAGLIVSGLVLFALMCKASIDKETEQLRRDQQDYWR
jgi:type II secretory pathway component PulL